jgi:16S rRNA (cytosine1402-N4)-methyltransferase
MLITVMTVHKSVLLDEAVEALNLKEGMIVVDATLGGGGHSKKILEKIGSSGTLVAFDWDEEAIERFADVGCRLSNGKDGCSVGKEGKITRIANMVLVNESFANIGEILDSLKIKKVDAIIADFGISSDQLDDARRGLSFQVDSALDMRLDRSGSLTAFEIVNTYGEDNLKRIIREYGDEKFASRIARAIVAKRTSAPINGTKELAELIEKAVPAAYRYGKTNPATKTFQALRIEVNGELDAIKAFIPQAIEALDSKGRLALISFHSGEDSIAKHSLREYARGCICPPEIPICRCGHEASIRLVTRKPVLPSEEEVALNPRARSAKLRVAEKI